MDTQEAAQFAVDQYSSPLQSQGSRGVLKSLKKS